LVSNQTHGVLVSAESGDTEKGEFAKVQSKRNNLNHAKLKTKLICTVLQF